MNLLKKFLIKYRKKNFYLSLLVLGACTCAFTTYLAITRENILFDADKNKTIIGLIVIDIFIFTALISIIFGKLYKIFKLSKNQQSGSLLLRKIVLMFSLGTAIPTAIIAIFAFIFFNYGIHPWFSDKVSTALNESVAVAESYLKEHKENIKLEASAMVNDIMHSGIIYNLNDSLAYDFIEAQSKARSLHEVIVFKWPDQRILIKSRFSFSLNLALSKLKPQDIENVDKQLAIILDDGKEDRVRALVKFNDLYKTYLLVGRSIDSKVREHTSLSIGAANEYNRLKSEIKNLKIEFSILFLIGAMLLLFASIAKGIVFATEITAPIKALLKATELVRTGDYSAKVSEQNKNDEISILGRAFNLMTIQLFNQRRELIEAAKQIDEKRYFNEAIIEGVSAGIIALDVEQKVSVINKSASNMLYVDPISMIGEEIIKFIPEFISLLNEAKNNPDQPVQSEIHLTRNGKKTVLLVRTLAQEMNDYLRGYIITFDDITALLIAQRSSAWADIARRIAHEIRNPLTPIKLASERLRKKYSNEVSDQETFIKYTDTISHHTASIGGIIEEFVNFAKLPSPKLGECNLVALINNAVFSRLCLNNNFKFELDIEQEQINVNIDSQQIDQVLINILKNAEESIEHSKNFKNGLIKIKTELNTKFVTITISDNGSSFPANLINHLTEPYVTTKAKGTGLGLAIVKKIIDDHKGSIEFANNDDVGANVKINLPL